MVDREFQELAVVVEVETVNPQHGVADSALELVGHPVVGGNCRDGLVGSGDRSERIRTYNFPQGRVSDHRINLTLYKIGAIMDGELDEILRALAAEHQAEQLAQLAEAN